MIEQVEYTQEERDAALYTLQHCVVGIWEDKALTVQCALTRMKRERDEMRVQAVNWAKVVRETGPRRERLMAAEWLHKILVG